MDCALIAECVGEERDRLRTIALFAFGSREDVVEFAVAGTPCNDTIQQGFCYVAAGVRELYPGDRILAILEAEAFVAIPLRDAKGTVIGLMAVTHRQPLMERAELRSRRLMGS